MIGNKFVYEKDQPNGYAVHIIDTGLDKTYCGLLKAQIGNGLTRRYNMKLPDEYTICPVCHKENKRRHMAIHLKPIIAE